MGMKQILVVMASVVLGGGEFTPSTPKGKPEVPETTQAAEAVAEKDEAKGSGMGPDPNDPNNVTIEVAIRKSLKYIGESPTGELPKRI